MKYLHTFLKINTLNLLIIIFILNLKLISLANNNDNNKICISLIKDKNEKNQFTYKITFKNANVPIISSGYFIKKDSKRKLYELFSTKLTTHDDSFEVLVNLKDVFLRYEIIKLNENEKIIENINYEKLKNYEILVEYFLISDYKEAKSFGGFGKLEGLFSSPLGIAVSNDDKIYVCDSNNDRIQKFDEDGNFIYEFGGFSWNEKNVSFNNITNSNNALFNEPTSIAISTKNIYVCDSGNNQIQKFDRDANFILAFGGDGKSRGRFNKPLGIACDKSNYLWVCDSKNDRIQKFDFNGNFIFEIGGFGYSYGKFNEPIDIFIDSSNFAYILDHGNKRISKFSEYGNYINEISLQKIDNLKDATTINNFFDKLILIGIITNDNKSYLCFLNHNGQIIYKLNYQFKYIAKVATDSKANIYVSDKINNKIIKFNLPQQLKQKNYLNLNDML